MTYSEMGESSMALYCGQGLESGKKKKGERKTYNLQTKNDKCKNKEPLMALVANQKGAKIGGKKRRKIAKRCRRHCVESGK